MQAVMKDFRRPWSDYGRIEFTESGPEAVMVPGFQWRCFEEILLFVIEVNFDAEDRGARQMTQDEKAQVIGALREENFEVIRDSNDLSLIRFAKKGVNS